LIPTERDSVVSIDQRPVVGEQTGRLRRRPNVPTTTVDVPGMTPTTTSVALALALFVALAAGVAPFAVLAQQADTSATIEAESTDPNAFTTHVVVVAVDENTTGDVDGLRIDYGDADVDTGEIDDNRIEEFGIDRGGDEPGDSVDVRLDDDITDIESADGGRVLVVETRGGRLARVGDEVVLSYRIRNPPEDGAYEVEITYNPRSNGVEQTAELRIGDVSTPRPTPTFTPTGTPTLTPLPTPTPSPEPTATPTAEPTPTPTTTEMPATATPEPTPAPTTTETAAPGFGVAATVAALGALVAYGWRRTRGSR
jgi:hypothetical protein